jgi:hypothetical protein
MLEVVAVEARWLPVLWVQHVEPLEQAHRRSHPHEHLTEVGEDHHQRDGVWRQVLKLKPVVLQQHEKKGGRHVSTSRHEPGQGICREVDKVARLGERQHPTLHL